MIVKTAFGTMSIVAVATLVGVAPRYLAHLGYAMLYYLETFLPFVLMLLCLRVLLAPVALKRPLPDWAFGLYFALFGTALSIFIRSAFAYIAAFAAAPFIANFATFAVLALLIISAIDDYMMYRKGDLKRSAEAATQLPLPVLVKAGKYRVGIGDFIAYSAAVHTIAVETLKFGVIASALSVAVALALLYAGILLTHAAFPARERAVPALPIPVALLAALALALWAA